MQQFTAKVSLWIILLRSKLYVKPTSVCIVCESRIRLVGNFSRKGSIKFYSDVFFSCVSLLQNSRNQAAVMQKIREINASRRYHALGTQSSGPAQYGQVDGGSLLTGGHSLYPSQLQMPPNMLHHPFMPSQHSFVPLMERARNLRIVDLPFYDKVFSLNVLKWTQLSKFLRCCFS